MAKIRLINDWRYLFKKWAIGGRFSAFTFVQVSYMRTGEPMIDGFTVVALGLGFTLAPTNKPSNKRGAK